MSKSLDIKITSAKLYSIHLFLHNGKPEPHLTLHLFAGTQKVSDYYLRPPESMDVPDDIKAMITAITDYFETKASAACQLNFLELPAPMEVNSGT